jgi:glycosyltransferase involved in cell wall biosynthesis
MIRNILICTTQVPFTAGGAEAHVAGLNAALTKAGYNVEVVALPFRWYPPVEIMRSTLMWRLVNLAESNGKPVDLVIGMKFPAYVVAHPRKVLWVMHQHRSAYNLWNTPFDDLSHYPEGVQVRDFIHRCDRKFLAGAKKIFANSVTVADRLRRYNQIESEALYHPPPRSTSLFSGPLGDYIYCPSRLEPQKRQHLLIEAMRYVKAPVQLMLAGGSGSFTYYESLVKDYGLQQRVQLLGYVDEKKMVDLYANALAVAYVPFDEDYGYVTLEGMLSSRPLIVTSDSGGPREFVEDRVTGFVIAPEPQEIANAIDELHHDRDRALSMGKQGAEKIASLNLSWDQVVERLISAAA